MEAITGRRVAIWDPNAEWSGEEGPQVEHTVVHDLRKFALQSRARGGRIDRVLVFQLDSDKFDTWVKWALATGDQVLVIDEAALVLRDRKLTPVRERLLTTSRHANVDLYICSQRPAQLSPDVRGQADLVFAFKMNQRLDIEALRRDYGDAFADSVPKLGKYKHATWVPG